MARFVRKLNHILSGEDPDRTVHVTVWKIHRHQNCRNELFAANKFFEQFGKIQSVRSRCKKKRIDAHCVYIQFEDADVAAKLLVKRHITDFETTYEIKPKRKCDLCRGLLHNYFYKYFIEKRFSVPMLEPPAESSPSNILNALDDQCLREIFERIHQVSDFYTISNVCMRFNEVAKEAFASKFKHTSISIDEIINSRQITLAHLLHFLQNYGASIVSLSCPTDQSTIVLQVINEYCKKLRHLKICITSECKVIPIETYSLFEKLKSLDISFQSGYDYSQHNIFHFILACPQLESLKIRNFHLPFEIVLPAITLPKLTEFKCYNYEKFSVRPFLQCNPQLENLQTFYSADLCYFIRECMPNLKTIKITHAHQPGPDLDDLRRDLMVKMSGLRKIEDMDPMANVTSLQMDYLNYVTGSNEQDIINVGVKFPKLKRLKIVAKNPYDNIFSHSLIEEILRNAHQLTDLTISFPDAFCLEGTRQSDYRSFLDIVKNRTNRKKLNINIESRETPKRYQSKWQRKLNVLNSESERLTLIRMEHIYED